MQGVVSSVICVCMCICMVSYMHIYIHTYTHTVAFIHGESLCIHSHINLIDDSGKIRHLYRRIRTYTHTYLMHYTHRFHFTANTMLLKGERLVISGVYQDQGIGQPEYVQMWEGVVSFDGSDVHRRNTGNAASDGTYNSSSTGSPDDYVFNTSSAVWSNSTLRITFARDISRYERFSFTVRLRNPTARPLVNSTTMDGGSLVTAHTSVTVIQPTTVQGDAVLTGRTASQFVVCMHVP
jgi:hypothetical protein